MFLSKHYVFKVLTLFSIARALEKHRLLTPCLSTLGSKASLTPVLCSKIKPSSWAGQNTPYFSAAKQYLCAVIVHWCLRAKQRPNKIHGEHFWIKGFEAFKATARAAPQDLLAADQRKYLIHQTLNLDV